MEVLAASGHRRCCALLWVLECTLRWPAMESSQAHVQGIVSSASAAASAAATLVLSAQLLTWLQRVQSPRASYQGCAPPGSGLLRDTACPWPLRGASPAQD